MSTLHDDVLQALLDSTPPHRRVPLEFLRVMMRGWAVPELDCDEWAGASPRVGRRDRVARDFPGDTLVIPAGRPSVRSNDLFHSFRPATDHTWLVGPSEPGSVLVLHDDHDPALYLEERPAYGDPMALLDSTRGALWEGPPEPLAHAAARLGLEVRPRGELAARLASARGRVRTVGGLDPEVDANVPSDGRELERQLARHRLIKDEYEIGQLRNAVDSAVEGFAAVVRSLPDAVKLGEAYVEGLFTQYARTHGRGIAYNPVVGGGPRSTVLHWFRNDSQIGPDDLLLLDAGVEGAELYSSDITRTLPVSGRFSSVQRDVHDVVSAAHSAALAAVAPGSAFTAPHRAAQDVLLEGLRELRVLEHPGVAHLDDDSIGRRWTLHGTSHMLGVDVHDCLVIADEYMTQPLAAGHVLTVEPGLYFSPHDVWAPAHLRGIGIRIEDDVLVTETGANVLSSALPRSTDAVEAWVQTGRFEGTSL